MSFVRAGIVAAVLLFATVLACSSLFSNNLHYTLGSAKEPSTVPSSLTPLVEVVSFPQTLPLIAGANIAVSSNPAQNEPSIAINPNNPDQEVVGANEEKTGNPWLGSYNSSDGGLHWTTREIPHNGNLSKYSFASDPSVVFDNQGHLYYSGLAFNIDIRNVAVDGSVFVSRSLDHGGTYNQTILVSTGSVSVFNDKPYLAVDRSSGTFSGRLYVSWTRFTSSTTSDIMISESGDNGATFSRPLVISSSSLNQGSVPIVGLSGEIYVVWSDLSHNDTVIVKSTNGGTSFSAPSIVSSYVPLPSPLPNGLFRVNSFPTASVDDTNGNVYVAWSDYSDHNATIRFTRSTDGGKSWSTSIKVNDNNTGNENFFPWISLSSGRIAIIFYGAKLDPANQLVDVYFTSSTNNGTSFSASIRVTSSSFDPNVYSPTGQSFVGDYIGIASSANFSQVVWTDTRNATPFYNDENIFTARVGNPPAIAVTGSQSVGEGHLLRLQATATETSDNGPLKLGAERLPTGANFTLTLSSTVQASGYISWTPTEGQGPASYVVEFGSYDSFFSSTENVTLQVNDANFPPVILVPSSQTVNETGTLTFSVSAIDPDGAEETFSFSCNCPAGASFNASTGIFTWTPAEGQSGNYTVRFTATDNGIPPLSDSKSVFIHVRDVNFPPTINPVAPQTGEDETRLNFTVTATDPDIPKETLSFSLGSDAPPGTTITTNGSFSWTPFENQASRTYDFTILVSDGTLQASEKVIVNVTEGMLLPDLFVPDTQTAYVGSKLTFKVSASYADIDDNQGNTGPIMLSVSNAIPEGASFDPGSGTFQWIPVISQSFHQYTIVFVAAAPTGASVTKSVTIRVFPALQSINTLSSLPSLQVAVLLAAAVASAVVAIFILVNPKKKPLQGEQVA